MPATRSVPQLQEAIAALSDVLLRRTLEHFLADSLLLTSAMKGLQNRAEFRAWWTAKIEAALTQKKLLTTHGDEQFWQEAVQRCANLNPRKLKGWLH